MKGLLLLLFLTLSYVALGRSAPARASREADTLLRAAASTGYWVVESNVRQPRQCTLYFYNARHELVYQESLTGVRLNLDRRRTVARLNRVLDAATDAHERRAAAPASGLVALQFAR